MSDPRKNLPSASSFPRYALCPGSFLLERQAPPEPESEDAASGTRIHVRLAGDCSATLSPEEEDLVTACFDLALRTAEEVLGGEPELFLREQRLWLHDLETLSPMCSGQFDVFARRGKKVLIIDYKTGRNPVIAEESWQLRALVALAVENAMVFHEDELTVAIVQPLDSPQVKAVAYSPKDRELARVATREIVYRIASDADPRRIPSDAACQYCRAKAICPEASQVVERMAITVLPDGRSGEVLDGATAAAILDRCGLAMKVIGSIQARAKAMLAEDPNSIPGWGLREGAMRVKIVDVGGVWKRVAELIPAADFATACSLTKTNAKGMIRSVTGLKGKALDEKVSWAIEGCTESKQSAPQLVRTGSQAVIENEVDTGD